MLLCWQTQRSISFGSVISSSSSRHYAIEQQNIFSTLVFKSESVAKLTIIKYQHSSKPFDIIRKYMKAVAFLVLTLIDLATGAQAKLPSKAFYAHESICYVFGGMSKDYVLQLYPDSTLTLLVRMNQTGNYLKPKQKIEFQSKGTYWLSGDTLIASYQAVQNINNSTWWLYRDSATSIIANNHPARRFLMERNCQSLRTLDWSMPQMELISLIALNKQMSLSNPWKLNPKSSFGQKNLNVSR